MYYAGIGSRETPKEILELFERIAVYLAQNGYVLRSGGADGADKAFEVGCDKGKGQKEIYLPWPKFNHSSSHLVVSDTLAFDLAKKYHPAYDKLSDAAKKLQARNTHQILGWDLKSPSYLVICWTPHGKAIGGTAQALRIAKDYNIPIFNAGAYTNIIQFKKDLLHYLNNIK